jgi:hypothetical protein
MEEVKIKLSAIGVVLMLTYLLGDVLRIFSGDFVAGEMSGMQITQAIYLVEVCRSMLKVEDGQKVICAECILGKKTLSINCKNAQVDVN